MHIFSQLCVCVCKPFTLQTLLGCQSLNGAEMLPSVWASPCFYCLRRREKSVLRFPLLISGGTATELLLLIPQDCRQWWKVTQYIYSNTVIMSSFEVFVLYCSISISCYVILPLHCIYLATLVTDRRICTLCTMYGYIYIYICFVNVYSSAFILWFNNFL